jgi:hypothetical protein
MYFWLKSQVSKLAPKWEERSAAALASTADFAPLVINPIIYAELSVGIAKIEELGWRR